MSTRTQARRSSLCLLCLVTQGLLAAGCAAPATPRLEVLPQHFLLQPGEQIHYQVLERSENGRLRSVDYEFSVEDPKIVRPIAPKGVLEAETPGSTELMIRTPTSERRVRIDVAGAAQPPMVAVPHSTVREIVGKELLFVGHANLDGFDHTAIAKPGIDRLVREARKNGVPVVYWVSQEYPNWYTADRHPDYAIISEGQEHQVRVDAERVTFSGGSFMFCVLRNVQMTLHGMAKRNDASRIHFVFPADAVWVEDIWGPGEKRGYPSPMVLLATLFARRATDAQAYDEVVVPFLDRVIREFPVAGYPRNPPGPPLSDLLKEWNIVVRFDHRFERVYRHSDSNKLLFVEFQGV